MKRTPLISCLCSAALAHRFGRIVQVRAGVHAARDCQSQQFVRSIRPVRASQVTNRFSRA